MFYYSYKELYRLIDEYNRKKKTDIDINELLDPKYGYIQKLSQGMDFYRQRDKDLFKIYQPAVIYEDENYFGIYKPPYWIVNVGSKDKRTWNVHLNMDRNLLQVWLYKNLSYSLKDNIDLGYGICNRLDINTSGIVIVAKNKKEYLHLRREINDHRNTKKNILL